MSQSPSQQRTAAWITLALMTAALALRVLSQHHILDSLPNLSPLVAFAFTGAILFPRLLPWWIWPATLLAVDWFSGGDSWWIQTGGHAGVLVTYACYAAVAFAGSRFRDRASVSGALIGTLVCSVAFYLVTNSLSWWLNPAYAKTVAGWVQALTTGVPGVHPTTIEFFRNSLIADLLGSAALLIVYHAEALVRGLRTMSWTSRSETSAALA